MNFIKKNSTVIILCLFFVLTSFQCEDDFLCDDTEYIVTQDVSIQIERTSNIIVNDTLWVSLTLNKEITDNQGNNINLDLDDTFGLDDTITTEFKNNFDEYSSLNFGSFILEDKGEIKTDNGIIFTRFTFDNNANAYLYRFGLILKDKGNYRLNVDNFYSNSPIRENCSNFSYEIPIFFDDGQQEKTQTYTFTVN